MSERKTREELADRISLEAFLPGHPHAQRGVLLVEDYLDKEKVLEARWLGSQRSRRRLPPG